MKPFILFSLFTESISTMSLLRFCALLVVVPMLSVEGQKAFRFNKIYLNLMSKGLTWLERY